MASTRDKKRARALMRANPDLNYTAALRQVQADRDGAEDRPDAEVTEIVLDEAYSLNPPHTAARDSVARALRGPALPELPTEYVREKLREHLAHAEAPIISLGDGAPGRLDPFALSELAAPAEEAGNGPSPMADDPDLHAVANDPTLDEGTRKAARDLLQSYREGADRDTVGTYRTEPGFGKSDVLLRRFSRESRARGTGSVLDDPHQPDGVRRGTAEGDPTDPTEDNPEE